MANEELEDVERGGDDDMTRGRGILQARANDLAAMPMPDKPQGVNLERAAFAGLSTYERVIALGLRGPLEALPAHIFKASCITDVEELSLALLVTSRQIDQTSTTGAQVPESLNDECSTLREEMIKVVRYALDDEEDAMKRLALIISGTGYKDKANDLANLGSVYDDYAEKLAEKGGSRYKPEHADEARKLATRLRKALTGTVLPTSPLAVAWKLVVLLEAAHQELLDGIWILTRHENRTPWTGLRAMSRKPAKRKKAAGVAAGATVAEATT
jgi:hypothetical protein